MRSQLLVALVAVTALAGCGGDSEPTTAQKAPAVTGTDLSPVKDYLLDHTWRLQADTARLASQAAPRSAGSRRTGWASGSASTRAGRRSARS